MKYNIDFLIAGLIFLCLILYHFKNEKQLDSQNNKLFSYFILIGLADIFFDIVCTTLISLDSPSVTLSATFFLTILYFLQAAVPYFLLQYTRSLRPGTKTKLCNAWAVPVVLMWVIVLLNINTGWFFYFDHEGIYHTGPLYLLMYCYALLYIFVIVAESLYYYKLLGKVRFRVIWEFLIIGIACTALQAYSGNVLLIGFGISLGITVLFLTINNPYEYTDTLTRLFNAQYFKDWIAKEFRKDNPFHLLSIDLRSIKQINKVWGNTFGDRFLAQVGEELTALSPNPYLFRVSGKRFILIAPSLSEYEKLRSSIQTLFCSSFEVHGNQIVPSVVICGILDAHKLKHFDTLLGYVEYLSTLAPTVENFVLIQGDEETMNGFNYNQEIERYLQTAIEKDLFELYFHPIYSISEQKYVSVEALSRLTHPKLGAVSPGVFIDIAEKNGAIFDIDMQQFRKLCQFVSEHKNLMKHFHSVKFNMYPAELLAEGYSQKIIKTIREFDLDYSFFQFEITESIATEYSSNLLKSLEDFSKVGIEISLDDFGSGYANLDTVLKLPFTTIKLDRSLLHSIDVDRQSRSFYQSIVKIFSDMGYQVIAEGVETEHEMNLVTNWGVDLIQGFYYSKPLKGSDLLELIS